MEYIVANSAWGFVRDIAKASCQRPSPTFSSFFFFFFFSISSFYRETAGPNPGWLACSCTPGIHDRPSWGNLWCWLHSWTVAPAAALRTRPVFKKEQDERDGWTTTTWTRSNQTTLSWIRSCESLSDGTEKNTSPVKTMARPSVLVRICTWRNEMTLKWLHVGKNHKHARAKCFFFPEKKQFNFMVLLVVPLFLPMVFQLYPIPLERLDR